MVIRKYHRVTKKRCYEPKVKKKKVGALNLSEDEEVYLTIKPNQDARYNNQYEVKRDELYDSFTKTKFSLFLPNSINMKVNETHGPIEDSCEDNYSIYTNPIGSKTSISTPIADNQQKSLIFNTATKCTISPIKNDPIVYDDDQDIENLHHKMIVPVKPQSENCISTKRRNTTEPMKTTSEDATGRLSNILFNPGKRSKARATLALRFLTDKLGLEKIKKIEMFYKQNGFDRDRVLDMLENDQHELIQLIEYVFADNQTPENVISKLMTLTLV